MAPVPEFGKTTESTLAADPIATAQATGRSAADLSAPSTGGSEGGVGIRRLLDSYALLGVWLLMAVGFAIGMPSQFLHVGTAQTIFGSQAVLIILALSALCTLMIGEFDLSFSAVMGVSATLICVLAGNHGVNIGLACLIAVVSSLACGAVNALLIVRFGISSLVITLGMATLLAGIAEMVSSSLTVSINDPAFFGFATHNFLGMPVSFYYCILLMLLFAYVTSWTSLGRHMLFVGSNRDVARLAGIRVNRVRAGGYLVSSLLSGIGGVVLIASAGGYDPTTSETYLLPTLAAVFLGTAVVKPGRFNPIGALIGIFFLETGIFGLQLLGLAGWIQDVFYGGGLVVAVALAALVRSRTKVA